jgi:hypothetical protein
MLKQISQKFHVQENELGQPPTPTELNANLVKKKEPQNLGLLHIQDIMLLYEYGAKLS